MCHPDYYNNSDIFKILQLFCLNLIFILCIRITLKILCNNKNFSNFSSCHLSSPYCLYNVYTISIQEGIYNLIFCSSLRLDFEIESSNNKLFSNGYFKYVAQNIANLINQQNVKAYNIVIEVCHPDYSVGMFSYSGNCDWQNNC